MDNVFELHELLLVFYVNFCLLFENWVWLANFSLNHCLKVLHVVQSKFLRRYPHDLFVLIDHFSRLFRDSEQLCYYIQPSLLLLLSLLKLHVHAWYHRINVLNFFLLKFLIPLFVYEIFD